MKNMFRRIIAIVMVCAVIASISSVAAFAAEKNAFYSEFSGLPTAYIDRLWEMQQKHPNWTFKAYNTGLDWDTAVANECSGSRCLVYIKPNSVTESATRLYCSQSYGSYVSKAGFDYDYVVRDGSDSSQTGWVDASPMAVAFYMNPYNFINSDSAIMQFESLEWNFGEDMSSAVAAVEAMLSNTFMSKSKTSTDYVDANGNITYLNTSSQRVSESITYAQAICNAAKTNNLNPCYLTSKIIGEVGSNGSGSTTGTHTTYPGYYNYLNIGANDSSSGNAVTNGLSYAKSQGWTSPSLAISGGAATIKTYYVDKGQNTAYLQKFNVTSTNTYNHQYMTAVNGVMNTTYSTYKGYVKAGLIDENDHTKDVAKTFYIPVYKNMPNATSSTVKFNGYSTGTGTAIDTASIRNKPVYNSGSSVIGQMNSGSTVTMINGYGCEKIVYEGTVDGTVYRMFLPLWYKITCGSVTGYVFEDSVNTSNRLALKKGSTVSLNISKSGGSETPRFMSLDTRIATVNATTGAVTGVSNGTTKIVVYLANRSFDVLNVTVSNTGTDEGNITSGSYVVNNSSNTISKISVGTTVNTFISKLQQSGSVTVTRNGKTLSSSDKMTTGCVVTLTSSGHSYTAVVKGDIGENGGLGDGVIDISDLISIRDEALAALKGTSKLSGANWMAADIDGSGEIDIDDLIAVRDHILGRKTIS